MPTRLTGSNVGLCECSKRSPEAVLSVTLANPKSSTFTVPSGRRMMLPGFRSRWTMPFSCASSSASAICLAIRSASSSGTAPCLIRSDRVGPSTSSITR